MSGGEIRNNTASGGSGVGAGVYISGNSAFLMSGGTVSGNIASTNGGGVYVYNGTFTLSGGTVSGNTASGNGGGVYVNSGAFTLSGGTVSGNTASGNGGGIYVNSGAFTMSGGTIYGSGALANSATGDGAALHIAGGTAQYDGAYAVYGTLTTTDNTIPALPPDPPTARIVSTGVEYAALSDAFAAAPSSGTSVENPTEIVICKNIDLEEEELGAINGAFDGIHVRLFVEAGMTYTIKRVASANTTPMFTVDSSTESLAIGKAGAGTLIIDGGAVWTGATDSVLGRGTTNSGVSASGPIVSVAGGTFTLNEGGILQNNQNTGEGGAVYVGTDSEIGPGTFSMSGGTIANNAAADNGGGVSCKLGTTFTMSGGTVSGNSSSNGGGVYAGNGSSGATITVTMSGGVVTNNSASGDGGGVHICWTAFTMSGGVIQGNKANRGGGLCNNSGSSFTMNGGVIYGTGSGLANTATSSCASYFKNGTGSAAFGSTAVCLGGYVGTTSKSSGASISDTNDTIQAIPKP
jgi:parallel beta-helix repeat protein